jgi:signal transduction histidine kinase
MVNFLLDTPLNVEQLDYCHTISSSSDGLLTVINDILDLSKVEAGMMRLNAEWFRIHSLIEDANELLSTLAISKNLELNYIVEENVPPIVCGDRVRLRQVLLNVIGVSNIDSPNCSILTFLRMQLSSPTKGKYLHDAASSVTRMWIRKK